MSATLGCRERPIDQSLVSINIAKNGIGFFRVKQVSVECPGLDIGEIACAAALTLGMAISSFKRLTGRRA